MKKQVSIPKTICFFCIFKQEGTKNGEKKTNTPRKKRKKQIVHFQIEACIRIYTGIIKVMHEKKSRRFFAHGSANGPGAKGTSFRKRVSAFAAAAAVGNDGISEIRLRLIDKMAGERV